MHQYTIGIQDEINIFLFLNKFGNEMLNRFIFFMVVICSCKNTPENTASLNPIAGTAWEMDYSQEIKNGDTIDHVPDGNKRIKMFSNHRYVFTAYDYKLNKIVAFGGGTYTYSSGQYFGKIEFHSAQQLIGKENRSIIKLENNYLFQTNRIADSLVLIERWHKID